MSGNDWNSAGRRQRFATRQKFRKMLREGALDEREIEVELSAQKVGVEIMAPPGMEDLSSQLQGMLQNIGSGKTQTRRMKVADALKALVEEEAPNLVNEDEIKLQAVEDVEQNGIVFLDEIDKVCQAAPSGAPTSPARACSATCCRWSKAARCRPSTAW